MLVAGAMALTNAQMTFNYEAEELYPLEYNYVAGRAVSYSVFIFSVNIY